MVGSDVCGLELLRDDDRGNEAESHCCAPHVHRAREAGELTVRPLYVAPHIYYSFNLFLLVDVFEQATAS